MAAPSPLTTEKPISSLRLCALQISANGQWACIEFLEFRDSRIKGKWTEMTDNESSNARLLGNAANDLRRRMKRMLPARGYREVHNQNVGSLGKLHKPWMGPILIGAEHD